MADDPRTDLHTPQPNKLLDAYRQQILAVFDEAKANTAGVNDNYWLADLAFSLIDSALADVATAAAERTQLRVDVDALTARLDALEPPLPDQEVP